MSVHSEEKVLYGTLEDNVSRIIFGTFYMFLS